MKPYLDLPAIKVVQPLGIFYSVMIPADKLEKITYVARAKYKKGGVFNSVFSPIEGTQREASSKRERQIADYINSTESALPNTVILGANIKKDGSLVGEEKSWFVKKIPGGFYRLIIPIEEELASVIDGQHRLNGCIASERKSFELLCSIYLDIPAPYHAYLFATINANQKPVDKSLAYDLYGFGLDEESRDTWSPEKFAVYVVRKLAAAGPMQGKILLGAQHDDEDQGMISLAALVDSILSLISSNPKKDRDAILYQKNTLGRKALEVTHRSPPLRQKFVDGDDAYIEAMLTTFISDIFSIAMDTQAKNSFLLKTVGIQALFGYLKMKLKASDGLYSDSDIQSDLETISELDFEKTFYNASGMGLSRIRNVILLATGLKNIHDLEKSRDYKNYVELFESEISVLADID